MRRSGFWLSALVLAMALTPNLAAAQVGRACHLRELCPNEPPGPGRILRCLRAHKDELSKDCLAAVGWAYLNQTPRGEQRPSAPPSPPAPPPAAATPAPAAPPAPSAPASPASPSTPPKPGAPPAPGAPQVPDEDLDH
jgi:hypothetical protein